MRNPPPHTVPNPRPIVPLPGLRFNMEPVRVGNRRLFVRGSQNQDLGFEYEGPEVCELAALRSPSIFPSSGQGNRPAKMLGVHLGGIHLDEAHPAAPTQVPANHCPRQFRLPRQS